MVERLDHRQVGVGQAHILADETDPHRRRCLADAADKGLPLDQIHRPGFQAELPAYDLVEPLGPQDQGNLVEAGRVRACDHRFRRYVAQARDLELEFFGERGLAAADDGVGLHAPRAQLGDGMLSRLGLLLPGGPDERHQRDVHVADVLPAHVQAELPDRLEEGQDLDVADGAAYLRDHDVDVVAGESGDAALDLIGDVGDHLHGATEIVAAALRGDHVRVDRSGRPVGPPGEALVDEAFIVTEVEVGLTAVVGDEHLAVLKRVHGARVDIQVGIKLEHRHS